MIGTMYAPPVGGQFRPTGDIPSPNNGQFSYADVISMASKKTRIQVKPPEIYIKENQLLSLLHKKRRNQPKIADLL